MMESHPENRQKRKEEGKRLKQLKIAEAGGKRPRKHEDDAAVKNHEVPPNRRQESQNYKNDRVEHSIRDLQRPFSNKKQKKGSSHRFGRVMDQAPCRNRPRFSTVSIALPASVLTNCQTKELRTQMVGQIARAATIYHIDEIVVFDDKLSKQDRGRIENNNIATTEGKDSHGQDESTHRHHRSSPHEFMARLLEYCECPQYLRRQFFPMHPDLQFSGLLAPIDAPHHVRVHEKCKYREGVVLQQTSSNGNSLVNCGIRGRPVEIDRQLQAGIRCTVQIDVDGYDGNGTLSGKVVSPAAPREEDGTYWGYTTRVADSLRSALDDCPYGKYDLKIGTSERGDKSIDSGKFKLPAYKHAIIFFGGVAGIEECVDADETLKLPGSQSSKLFDMWINVCPFQGSRTIRTEEAVLISLAKLSCYLRESEKSKAPTISEPAAEPLSFSDDEPSEESSSSEGED